MVIFSDGFPGVGDSGDGGDGDFERIARTCAESALRRECALYETRSSSGCQLDREGFTGTVAELHTRLDSMVSDARRRSVRWPTAPNALSNAIRRMAANLCAAGLELQFSRNDE